MMLKDLKIKLYNVFCRKVSRIPKVRKIIWHRNDSKIQEEQVNGQSVKYFRGDFSREEQISIGKNNLWHAISVSVCRLYFYICYIFFQTKIKKQ